VAGGSSSDQERTEAPTEKRRQDAKREGTIPRSQELNVAVLLLVSALLLKMGGPALGARIVAIFGFGLAAVGSAPLDLDGSVALIREVGWRALLVVAAFSATLFAMALAIAGGQARGIMSGELLAPKWERLSPMANAKKVLGLQSWAELLKSLFKLLIVGIAVRGTLTAAWPDVMALAQQGPAGFVHVVQRYAVKLLTTAGVCYLLLALLDYLWQVWRTEQQLMMSRDEIKQETKQSEGDPLVKQRMRSFGRALARRQMMKAIPTADVVITNPTHIAVALKYDPDNFPAPIVVAMGQRKVAERIKAIAKEHGVPMVENRPLARALLASCRVGTMIPGDLYLAVAEILAFVFRRRMAAGKGLREVYA
jgi:flagellar biosynthetic protein FlhB